MTIPTEILAVTLGALLGAIGYVVTKIHGMDTRLARVEAAIELRWRITTKAKD